jgi:radical SAM enzyme (TIGR01210 family)
MSTTLLPTYPDTRAERNDWILARRPHRNKLDPLRPYAFFVEDEYSSQGEIIPVATVFLTNRECPWRCLMCDLWKNTLEETVPPAAIPAQIDYALSRLSSAQAIKLYNSGSFFDPRAIPLSDYSRILDQVATFDRVIVESHPSLIGENCFRFNQQLSGKLEVAMGLETVHPQVLERLNKGMTTEHFAIAAEKLRSHNIDLRVFILIKPPFMREEQAVEWSAHSLDFAFDCRATAATLISTRAGNGALDDLAKIGDFSPPSLRVVEAAFEYGLSLARGRVFVDLWDVEQAASCPDCRNKRIGRVRAMNLRQISCQSISCNTCGGRA